VTVQAMVTFDKATHVVAKALATDPERYKVTMYA
jgi:hypothetical protein